MAAGAALAGPASADTTAATAPSISASPLGTIQADQAFLFAYDVQGNPAPTLAVTSGALPPGLTLEGYVIAGRATDPRTYTWTATAHNGIGSDATATATDTIDVLPAPAGIDGNPPRGNVGEPYDFTFSLGGDPLPTATVTDGGLPPGLTPARTAGSAAFRRRTACSTSTSPPTMARHRPRSGWAPSTWTRSRRR